ncbi:MAG: radical SAM protein, partial [Helicobacter sp.]|nr:radical SAM protein [Helicobacter sp.]
MYVVGKARIRSQKSGKCTHISFKQVKKDIKQNPSQFFSTLSQYVAWKKHKLDKKLENIAMKFIRSYYKKRVKLGKVDIPYIELVLTTKCTL